MTTATEPKQLILTSVFNQLQEAVRVGKRRVFIEGGTWSSKTYSVLQLLILLLENAKTPLLATVTSESMPHLKGGAIADFKHIMGADFYDGQFNKTDFIYTFPKSGCRLEFVSADNPGRLTGPRRDILFCNEVNNILKDSYEQADMRTRLFTICDWNPTSEFWFHDQNLADDKENVFIHTTYLDSLEVLPESKRREIEAWELKDPNRWRVYGLGLLGKLEGLVYPSFKQVDKLPEGKYFYGLDYGFASDPTVLVKNVIVGENLYSQEMFYDDSALTNEDIARRMELCKVGRDEVIYPDPNEPKSAEELSRLRFYVGDTVKGPGSVEFGIKKVNEYYQHWTKDSLNCIKEQRNFRYIEDKKHPGLYTDTTTHQWSHGMSARRYAVASFIPVYHGDKSEPVSNH
ncbi:hypothetical protein LCGC14_1980520 [marine sediment metagenome]|uniref:Phage terminase large subunit N-terminal domain-containing protein n=1 Tax=marine sediment metagenome TaxID=412755 RepID=A0A0F9FXA5_9ZZZZ